jgi:hypothetical protein
MLLKYVIIFVTRIFEDAGHLQKFVHQWKGAEGGQGKDMAESLNIFLQ